MTIPEFIRICDAYCAQAGVSRTWLSKRLLKDTTRLQQLADGEVDIGVKRLARAVADLGALQREASAEAA
jgi:hypothetical protein